MILRRIKAHIAKEDWFSVFVDFVIVVFGVFIGIQVSNWNQLRGEQSEYKLALERIIEEAASNIESLDEAEVGFVRNINKVTLALEALRSCSQNNESMESMSQALNALVGTSTIHVQTTAVDEMTTSPVLLAQQSAETRKAFSKAKFNLTVIKTEADFAESLPFRDRPENNPMITISDPVAIDRAYYGVDTSGVRYSLELNEPISVACKNQQLIKSLYTWHRFQSRIPVYANSMRREMNQLIAVAKQGLLQLQ